MKTLSVTLTAFAAFGVGMARAESPQKRAPQRLEKLARLVLDLDDRNFHTREKATDELMRIGAPALPAVKKALRSESLEVCSRAQRIMRVLTIYGGGGRAVSGLKVRLTENKTLIKPE